MKAAWATGNLKLSYTFGLRADAPTAMLLAIITLTIVTVSGWVAVDAARHRRNWFGWAALVAITGGLGVPVWLMVRRRSLEIIQLGTARALMVFLTPLFSLLLLATVSAVTGAMFVFRVARVEGQAMAPTLKDQDRLLVNRIAYRLEHPLRGDLVMLRYPLNPTKFFVKRIIATEGEKVGIVDGHVYLNGARLDDPFVAANMRSRDKWGPQVVPPDSYFVLGDRRNNSADSRHWGYVPRHYIVGKVQVRWWPPSEARTF